mmetsp:Transcript_25950/g.36387  ORF Transcript_25950/g.36387 Transcript_25950/m.36387 type:complete len:216 (-) Transcript_25950:496-1143(-)
MQNMLSFVKLVLSVWEMKITMLMMTLLVMMHNGMITERTMQQMMRTMQQTMRTMQQTMQHITQITMDVIIGKFVKTTRRFARTIIILILNNTKNILNVLRLITVVWKLTWDHIVTAMAPQLKLHCSRMNIVLNMLGILPTYNHILTLNLMRGCTFTLKWTVSLASTRRSTISRMMMPVRHNSMNFVPTSMMVLLNVTDTCRQWTMIQKRITNKNQ